MDFYWYISITKVQVLKEGLAKSFRSYLDSVSVTLKTLWFEVGASLKKPQEGALGDLIADLKRIEKALKAEGDVKDFQSLSDGKPPVLFSFRGEATRMIDQGAYWVALERRPSALLLVGSASNAIGVAPRMDGQISPSADPMGAIKAMFVGSGEHGIMGSSDTMSYVWSTVWESDSGSLIRPEIEGLGVFGGMVQASKSLASRDGQGGIERIVVGSPVYIRQA